MGDVERCAFRIRPRSSFRRLNHRQDSGTELQDEVPLIGFAGAPWTLASYMIEGGGSKSFAEIKTMAYREPADAARACSTSSPSTVSAYLLFQIESGAQVVQLFDTWAGELNRRDYEEFALPYTQKIFEAIGNRVPRILYINGCSPISGIDGALAERMCSASTGESRSPKRDGERWRSRGTAGQSGSMHAAGSKSANRPQRPREILKQAGPTRSHLESRPWHSSAHTGRKCPGLIEFGKGYGIAIKQ